MSYSWQVKEEDEEEEDGEMVGFASGKNLTIFLVEATKVMGESREGDPDDYTALQRSLSCAHDTIKSKIFSGDQDCIGVVLFGSRPTKTDQSDFESVQVLLPLAPPSGAAILALERLLGDHGSATLEAEVGFGPEQGVRLHEALWQCQSMFAGVSGKVATKSILLLTCRSSPHTDPKLDAQARRKAVDLHNTDICLDVVPVCGPQEAFHQEKFYADLIKLAEDEVSLGVLPLEELSDSVLKKTTTKRSNGRLKLDLGGTVIAVSSFNLTRKMNKPSKQRMTADTNEEVKSSRRFFHPNTGAPLLPSDMNCFVRYGGRKIQMTGDEVKSVKALGGDQTYLTLCGFKPITCLKMSNFVKHSHFLYPHEETVRGSRVVFSALLQRCVERQVAAICKFKPRSTAEMSYVALVPQQEEVSEGGGQEQAPGFHVVYLPFLDDIRPLPITSINPNQVSQGAVQAAKEVISKLKLRRFQAVESVSLQSHYRMIEAHALKKTTLTTPEDETVPDLERMTRKLGTRSRQFLAEVYEEGYQPGAIAAKRPKAGGEEVRKRLKEEGGELDMEALHRAGTLAKLTVDQIKTWLKVRGVAIGNKKKAELVELVVRQLE